MSATPLPVARVRNNLPAPQPTGLPLPQRVLRSPWTWVTVVMALVYVAALVSQYVMMTQDIEVTGGVIPGLNRTAIRDAAWLAAPTLAFWTVVFIWTDRYRPQRLLVWFLTLGWGAAVATWLSLHINTWAAQHLAVAGNGDPAASARAAIFVAPFVEEAAKATVLFWIAILVRYRIVSKISAIVMAGLSAAGFAFTENIIYYARVIVYSSQTIDVGDAEAALTEIVWLRGFWTSFGHPLFTMLTGIGLAVALRTRSKVVRVLAPLVGFGAAAFLHMVFNSQASLAGEAQRLLIYFVVALPMVLSGVVYVARQVGREGRLIRERLADYTRMGWLPASDPVVFARQRTRWWAALVALTRGWTVFLATLRLQRALTELAYLRDAEVRGIVDDAARHRAKELLAEAASLRGLAIDDPRGLKPILPRFRRPALQAYPPPSHPGPAGLGGNWPAPTGPPVGSASYSPVNPTWGPPTG